MSVGLAAVAAGGCGAIDDRLVGERKGPFGATWQFKSDGMFAARGGEMKSVDGSGRTVPTIPRAGRWAGRDGVLTLRYDAPSGGESVGYRWAETGGRLDLARPDGATAGDFSLVRLD